jgi:hypothetical protein
MYWPIRTGSRQRGHRLSRRALRVRRARIICRPSGASCDSAVHRPPDAIADTRAARCNATRAAHCPAESTSPPCRSKIPITHHRRIFVAAVSQWTIRICSDFSR